MELCKNLKAFALVLAVSCCALSMLELAAKDRGRTGGCRDLLWGSAVCYIGLCTVPVTGTAVILTGG
jgi:hypothetical protein